MTAPAVPAQVAASARGRPQTRTRLTRIVACAALLDAIAIASAVAAAIWLRFGPDDWREAFEWFTGIPLLDLGWLVPLWMASLAVHEAYSQRHFARGADEFKSVLKASLSAALVASMIAYLVNYDMSRGFYVYVFALGTPLLLVERWLVSRIVADLRRDGQLLHRVVAVGSVAEICQLSAVLLKRRELGYEVVGACLPRGVDPAPLPVPLVGTVSEAVDCCSRWDADTLLVAGGSQLESADLRTIGWALEGRDIDLIVVPSLLDVAGPRIHPRPVSGLPFLHIEPPQVARAMQWGKAVFDRSLACLALLALTPVFIMIAIAILLDTGGPVLFRQQRVGVGGRTFGMWKFRSMIPDAEARRHDLVSRSRDPSGALFKLRSDPRVTRVGAFIRRYSLDELPQLVNVLTGDMSLVGPRPHLADEMAAYPDAGHRRLLVRPGMTGLWQVSGRSDLSWDQAVRLDLYYVDNWSMAGDLIILYKTFRAVLRHEGAY